jgi:glycosyltransferase involved in cell wall biosynthesis
MSSASINLLGPWEGEIVSQGRPRVTVGVPVFNGELFLAETLDSLLNQTLSDLEIVISDNASTDRTQEICRAYAARDPRVRYYRNDVNRGAAWNHNRVFELARGEFFKWSAADDLCAPEFLTLCVAALDRDPAAVMSITQSLEIDEVGNPLASVSVANQTLFPIVPLGAPAHVRFRQNIRLDHLCLSIFSLIRSDILRQTVLQGNYPDADRVLLAHLALFGHCVVIPKTSFFNRDHPGRFSRFYNGERLRERATWWDPSNVKRRSFPFWRELSELLGIVRRSPLEWRERLRCYWEIEQWLQDKGHMRLLYEDATYYPRKWIVRHFPKAKVTWNWLWRDRERYS